jgi:hypothetical protein
MTLAHLDGNKNKNKNSIFAPITPFFPGKIILSADSRGCQKFKVRKNDSFCAVSQHPKKRQKKPM